MSCHNRSTTRCQLAKQGQARYRCAVSGGRIAGRAAGSCYYGLHNPINAGGVAGGSSPMNALRLTAVTATRFPRRIAARKVLRLGVPHAWGEEETTPP
jgi:hypothetical protein